MEVIDDYKAIFTCGFDYSLGGRLPADQEQRFKDDVAGYCTAANPLTEEIWNRMTPEQQEPYKGKLKIWAAMFGLSIVSGGQAWNKLKEIHEGWSKIGTSWAVQHRKNAKWTGKNYLTDPQGRTGPPGGGKYTMYTMPYDENDMGEFDGVITDETKFTA